MAETKALKKCNTCGREYHGEADFFKNTNRWRICTRGHLWFNCDCGSTGMIIKGKFPWYAPDKTMSHGAKTVFNEIPQLETLPHIETAVMELQELLEQENVTSKKLADVAKKSPILAGNILSMANNMAETSGTQITSLDHAITYVGKKSVKEIALAAGIQAFPFQTKVFKPAEFWQECFLIGAITEYLAKKYNKNIVTDEAYLAGTLANLGKVVFALCLPEEIDIIERDARSQNSSAPWRTLEDKHGFYDHSILGEVACAFWGLPTYVHEASSAHHKHLLLSQKGTPFTITDLVIFANQLSHELVGNTNRTDRSAFEACLARFDIQKNQLATLYQELDRIRSSLQYAQTA